MKKYHIDVSGRHMYAELHGAGRPTVIIEVGSTQAGTKDRGWWPVREALAKETSVFFYDRAGLGNSDPAPVPRSIGTFTEDLHAMIQAANLEKPYILLGGSFGGLIVTHYAALHPEDVAGILLEDSTHPEHNQRTLALLPPETPGESQALASFRRLLWQETYAPLLTGEQEGLDIPASVIQMRAAWDLDSIPLIVLTAGQDTWEPGFPEDIAARYEQLWLDLQEELADRSSRHFHQIVEQSGHVIHDDAPQAVLDAVRRLTRGAV
jgi:pimeloyl-ACP methyl ester carboxylesterase